MKRHQRLVLDWPPLTPPSLNGKGAWQWPIQWHCPLASVAHRVSIPASISARRPPPKSSELSERRFLNEIELASRWGMSPKTLTRWRGMGRGPVFNKFSKKVAYPLDGENGVLDFEKRHVYASTSERVPV
ncbi:hypothetical protein QOU18_16135 [Pseudomonas aeruginosa]